MILVWLFVLTALAQEPPLAPPPPRPGPPALGVVTGTHYEQKALGLAFAVPEGGKVEQVAEPGVLQAVVTASDGELVLGVIDGSLFPEASGLNLSRPQDRDRPFRALGQPRYFQPAGLKFLRADYVNETTTPKIHQSRLFVSVSSWRLGVVATAKDEEARERLVSTLSSLQFQPSVPTMAPAPVAVALADRAGVKQVRVSQNLVQGQLIKRVQPKYPAAAKNSYIQGPVVMRAIIGKDGKLKFLGVVSGHPTLAEAALEAVRQWEYRPYYLEGEPVEVETTITVNFTLGRF